MLHTPFLRRSLAFGLILACSASLTAQNTINAGLQGDPSMSTPGGWVYPAAPPGNPHPNPATGYLARKIQLGKALFWDEQASSDNSMACATCHMPEVGGTDPRKHGVTANSLGQPIFGSLGMLQQADVGGFVIDYGFTAPASSKEDRGVTQITVPTQIGAYMFNRLFWDRRALPAFVDGAGAVLFPAWAAMESQAVGPPMSDIEMGHQNHAWASGFLQKKLTLAAPLALIVPGSAPASIPASWLGTTYGKLFDAIFAADPNPVLAAPAGVTRERFAMVISAYERTLVPDQAPIDTNTMTLQEQLGFDIFVASGCVVCHSVSGGSSLVNRAVLPGQPSGTLANPWDNSFSDGLTHDIFFPVNLARSVGRIKTPTLRNVGLRKRFFHDGRGRVIGGLSFNTLPDIVDFYDIDQDPANGGLGGIFELRGLGGNATLTAVERKAVIQFLGNALTDPRVPAALPPFDRPKLFSEAIPFGSNLTKPATASAPGWKPVMLANNPALVDKVGGPIWWKIGVGSAGAGAGAPIIPPGSTATLYLGVTDTNPGPFWLTGSTPIATVLTTGQGFATVQQPVVLSTSMIGVTAFFQWVVLDTASFNFGLSESAVVTAF